MKKSKIILLAFIFCLSFALFITGKWLMGIYGLDPPYIYNYIGLICVGASIFAAFTFVLLLVVEVIMLFTKQNNL